MKAKLYLLLIIVIFLIDDNLHAQNVGIGTVNPAAKLDVNGEIKVGATGNANPAAGTMRWNADRNDFEGFNGTAWLSLTGDKGSWGSKQNYSTENQASDFTLNYSGGYYGGYLGSSISVSGEYLLAGASGDYHLDQGGLNDAGTARLFKKDATGWKLFYSLRSPNPVANGNFGHSVGIDNNYLAVGERRANSNKGRVYLYTFGADGFPMLQASLAASDAAENDYFGMRLAISGTRVIVGVPLKDVNGTVNQGKAYIFQKHSSANLWVQVAGLTAPDGIVEDGFGNSVSISGGYAAVGAFVGDLNGTVQKGKVYVYEHQGGVTWNLVTTLTSPDTTVKDRFGSSVFLKGDTLVIGDSQNRGISDNGNGQVHVYARVNGSWVLQATVRASDGQQGDAFGTSVHLSNGQLIVGANKAYMGATTLAGKAYIFKLVGNTWVEQAVLVASNGAYGDNFGSEVAITDSTAIVSAPNAAVRNSNDNGRIYFFYK